jgi:GNAT superfamily N-acetyltransferase
VGDALGIRKSHRASIRKLCPPHYTEAQIEAWVAGLSASYYRAVIGAGHPVYVAVDGARVVRFSELHGDEVRAVYVRKRCAGQGIGRRLLSKVEHAARTGGRRLLRLSATLNAVRFYARLGYVRVGARKWSRLKHGTTLAPVVTRPSLVEVILSVLIFLDD